MNIYPGIDTPKEETLSSITGTTNELIEAIQTHGTTTDNGYKEIVIGFGRDDQNINMLMLTDGESLSIHIENPNKKKALSMLIIDAYAYASLKLSDPERTDGKLQTTGFLTRFTDDQLVFMNDVLSQTLDIIERQVSTKQPQRKTLKSTVNSVIEWLKGTDVKAIDDLIGILFGT